jgi:post-segregation antitoxin (ccd killing protein)
LAPSTRDRISVDLHGLKAALVARAQAEGVDVSVVVRRAVERELGQGDASRVTEDVARGASLATSTVKLSLRFTAAQAQQLAAGARQAGLSRGTYLAGLLAGVPSLTDGLASRPDRLAALNASCAELSTVSRNLHHLTTLLRQGQVRAAMEYRGMLDTLGVDLHEHLAMAAGLLAELRPARPARVALQQRRGASA